MPFKFASVSLSPDPIEFITVQSKKHIEIKLQKMAVSVDTFRRYIRNPTSTPHRSYPAGSTGLLDWVESPESYIFKINVPGYRKDGIKVQLKEGRVLGIKADCKEEKQEKFENIVWHLAERGLKWKGDFLREIELPGYLKVDQIKASLENGVLSVVVPKDSSPKPSKHKNVQINSKL